MSARISTIGKLDHFSQQKYLHAVQMHLISSCRAGRGCSSPASLRHSHHVSQYFSLERQSCSHLEDDDVDLRGEEAEEGGVRAEGDGDAERRDLDLKETGLNCQCTALESRSSWPRGWVAPVYKILFNVVRCHENKM